MLLINDQSDNPFGGYYREILTTEGLNCINSLSISSIDNEILNRFDCVILTEGRLTSSQLAIIESYVANGGHLIVMRPELYLSSILGLERISGSTSNGYIQINIEHLVSAVRAPNRHVQRQTNTQL